MRESRAGIVGLGSSLPAMVRGNDFWGPDFEPRSEERSRKDIIGIERSTTGAITVLPPEIADAMASIGGDRFHGAKQRHVLDDAAEPSDMEAEAGRRALRNAGVRPDEIDLLIVYSMVPDRLTPANGAAVQAKCELVNAHGWSMDLACATFQPSLMAADALIRVGSYRRALLVMSSAATRVMDYTTMASTVFGDGAGAAVIAPIPEGYGVLGHWSRTDGSLREGVVFAPLAEGRPQKRWDRGGGPVKLSTFDLESGKQAGVRSTQFCREACMAALGDAGLSIRDVNLYVGAQSVPWFVDACRRALELSTEQVIDTFGEVANIGAAALPYNLERAQGEGRLRDGDVVLMYAPGAGLTRSAIVYRWYAGRLT